MRLFGARRKDGAKGKYKVVMKYPGGTEEEEDEVFETEEAADEYGLEQLNNYTTGAEILQLMETGDSDDEVDEDDRADFEVIEVEEEEEAST
jgi:hypothetical protein